MLPASSMKKNVFRLKNSVDVYLIPIDEEKVHVQFYKINTREKHTLEVSSSVPSFLSKLDGNKDIDEIAGELGISFERKEAIDFLSHLEKKGFATRRTEDDVSSLNPVEKERFSRQASFFDELLPDYTGWEIQEKIINSEVVIVGVGAVGGDIAIQLARAGVGTLTIVDYKKASDNCLSRHSFLYKKDIGRLKVDVLKERLLEINQDINVFTIDKVFDPEFSVDQLLTINTNLVVNTADEPYIGHTTLKLGRELWRKGIALYSAGGFDAHAMCTGEFIIPGITPCADCYSNYFSVALRDWKPTYINNSEDTSKKAIDTGMTDLSINSLGAGGIAAQSMFSASYACIQIMKYISGSIPEASKLNSRGEYLPNSGKMTWVEMGFSEGCNCAQQ